MPFFNLYVFYLSERIESDVKIKKALLCAVIFLVMVSLMLPLGCAEETAQDILGHAVEAINEVESFHMIVTQTLTAPSISAFAACGSVRRPNTI